MAVIGPYGLAMEVPDLEPGIEFYTDAGLEVETRRNHAYFSCPGRDEIAITLIGGASRKRLHHAALRADSDRLDTARSAIPENGGRLIEPPKGFDDIGIWLTDPYGTVIHLIDAPPESALEPVEPFRINEPGHLPRVNASGIPPKASIAPVLPLRLGHMLFFSPDVQGSVRFFVDALDMRLTDHSDDAVAFMCTPHDSDHHVVAFAKSRDIGFHHASFQVATPDDVGRGGRALASKSQRGNWGFGRHTVGANFFHYIQDPWGSWFEYYADMDFISDYSEWAVTNYLSEDSLYNWGPEMPDDFVHNYEADDVDHVNSMGF